MEQQEFQDFDLDQQSDNEEIEDNPLFEAVVKNDFNTLKSLIEAGCSVNSKNRKGDPLIFYIIKHERVEMFDYILGLEEIQIDQSGNSERSAFFNALRPDDYEFRNNIIYFPLKLIHRGANIHLPDPGIDLLGSHTLLSIIIWNWDDEDSLTLGQMVIEKGYDVNAQDLIGRTPLYEACSSGKLGMIYMLLYYGAIASIPLYDGTLPIFVLDILTEDHANVVETLFRHTFEEGDRITVNLRTLVNVMRRSYDESPEFLNLVEIISQVDYDLSGLRYLANSLHLLIAKHFKLLVDKFGNILQAMIENFSCLTILIDNFDREPETDSISDIEGVLLTILESDCAAQFVQNIYPSYPTIARLTQMLETEFVDSDEDTIDSENIDTEDSEKVTEILRVTEIVCLMLSHGLNVSSYDLDMVYDLYGYCELFKILLHMDIEMIQGQRRDCSMARLYYDPSTDIETFFDKTKPSLDLLSYYNHPKLKELSLIDVDEEIAAKARSLPDLPSLVELSRNMARKFIISRYQIKNSMQFYTVLRWLPIGEMNKKIIALETELY